jgi:hypothetical protein
MAKPDLKSPNQTEQLLAEPEMQKLAAELEKLTKANLGKAMAQKGLPPGMSSEELVDFVKLVLVKPLAVYVSGVQMGPAGPAPRGAIAIKFDEDVDKVKAKLAELTKLLPPPMLGTAKINGEDWQTIMPAPQVTIVWGFQKKYFLAALGEGEMESLLLRARGEPPEWLTKLRQDLPIERVSTVGYLNVKAIRETFGPMGGPQAAVIQEAVGINNVSAIVSAAGLEQKGYVGKTLICLDGQPQGLLQFATIAPLSAADLAPIPADTGVALAVKINPLAAFDTYLDVMGKAEPRAKADMLRGVAQMESQFGLKLREEVLKPLGDGICLSASLGLGGMPDVTATVQVKEPQQAAKTYAKLMQIAEAMLKAQGANNPSAPKLDKSDVSGKTIYTLQMQQPGAPPISPSWCLTEKELIISISSQGVRSYLSRPAGFKSLAQSDEVGKTLSGDAGPTALLYCDVRGIFENVYPMLPALPMMLQPLGINLSLPTMPSAGTIGAHLTPLVASVRQTKAGIEATEQTPLPGLGITQSAPVAVALLLPAVQAAREAARRAQSLNELKEIGEAARGRQPTNNPKK